MGGDEDVGALQITMHDLLRVEVDHATADVHRETHDLGLANGMGEI